MPGPLIRPKGPAISPLSLPIEERIMGQAQSEASGKGLMTLNPRRACYPTENTTKERFG